VWSSRVVVVEPVWQHVVAVSMCAVGESVSPFAGHRLVEALDLSVGAGVSRPEFRGDGFDWFPTFSDGGSFRNLSSRLMSFVLGRRDASERCVQALVVEPGDVLNDGELELRSRSPDAIADEFGLEAVDEALGSRVVVGVTDCADRRADTVVVEGLAVVVRRVLTGRRRCDGRARRRRRARGG
jgi:hypothetical protein